MTKLIGIVAGLLVFGWWMNIVGNPHVVETVIGIALAACVGFLTWREAKKLSMKFSGSFKSSRKAERKDA